MSGVPAPLVSVIVRTMGRPSLPRAVASIAAQTWRPLEMVVVDAAARGVGVANAAGLPVTVVGGGPFDRPSAANAGLAAARGAWLLFLDEDDELDRRHVEQLLAVAMAAGLPVAYSQTLLVDAHGRPQRAFGGPFRRDALLQSNYLAIHAVLFHRRFVDEGCRFDTSLATFEDWDFWLQLAERTDFAFSGAATAFYHAGGGQSGAGSGANLDRDAVLAQREKLMAKWRGR